MLLTKLTQNDIGYIAGIIDGEGHFAYRLYANGRKEYYPQAMIVVVQSSNNNGEYLCNWFKERLGGYVYFIRKSNCWKWEIRGYQAELITSLIKNNIIAKKKQIDRIISKTITNIDKFNFNNKFYTKKSIL